MMPVSERLLVRSGEKLGAKRLASSCTTLIFLSLDLLGSSTVDLFEK